MASEAAEIVRAGCEAYIAGDLERALEAGAPDVEWDLSNLAVWPEEQVYRGPAAVLRFWEQWRTTWEAYEVELEELVDADPHVVTVMRQAGTARGVRVDVRFAQLWTVEDGRVTRMRMYPSRERALEALAEGARP